MLRYKQGIFSLIILTLIHLTFHILTVYGLSGMFSFHWLWLTLIGIILIRNVGGEIGGHRYYSHKSFKAKTWAEWAMSILFVYSYSGTMLLWSIAHRYHHVTSDTKKDPVSPHFIKNIKDFLVYFRFIFQLLDTEDKEYEKWNLANKFNMDVLKNEPARFVHNNYWLFALAPILLLLIDIRLLIYFIAIPSVITIWSFILSNTLSHINLTGCYKNFVIPDRSVNNPWMQLLLSTSGLHNNHHYNPSSYNLKMTDKWYEQDFLNVFLIEKFLKA